MKLQSIHISNYRRLKDVHIDIDPDLTIFVGANNSGKTAATHLLAHLLGSGDHRDPLTMHDFHAPEWVRFNELGNKALADETIAPGDIPTITLALRLQVEKLDLYRVVDLQLLGIRLRFEPRHVDGMLKAYKQAHEEAKNQLAREARITRTTDDDQDVCDDRILDDTKVPEDVSTEAYHPWPRDMCDFLRKRLAEFYTIRHEILNDDDHWLPLQDAKGEQKDPKRGQRLLSELIRVDLLSAQRHLTDRDSPHGSARSESISKRISRLYKRQARRRDANHKAMRSLHEAGQHLQSHLDEIFGPDLKAIDEVGTGHESLKGASLGIHPTLRTETILNENAEVRYPLREEFPLSLPDRHNGLGFKNSIYMTLELLESQQAWLHREKDESVIPLLHLVMIEEPEAHLHVQLGPRKLINLQNLTTFRE